MIFAQISNTQAVATDTEITISFSVLNSYYSDLSVTVPLAGITAASINDAIRQVVAGEMLTTADQVIVLGGAQ